MAQQPSSTSRSRSTAGTRAATQLIEKGWTVYDALDRPVGNVTEVDAGRGVLEIDGRSAGFTTFEAPLGMVARAGDNAVHLTQALDTATSSTDTLPRFVDPPAGSTEAPGGRTRGRGRGAESASATAGSAAHTPSTASASGAGMSGFSPPYATAGATAPASTQAPPARTNPWSGSKIAAGGLALGGVAATAFLLRRRMRRRTPLERLTDLATGALGATSDFARDRHPAWWASLAAAALPLAYYAWPSKRRPSYAEQARSQADDLGTQLQRYLTQLDFRDWRVGWRAQDTSWASGPNLATVAGALAAGALAVALIRRGSSTPRSRVRIADVMTRSPRVIHPDATVADAATLMRQLDVGALPVCDGSRLIGMLTDRDITIRSTADGRDPHLTPVRDVMSPGVAWATADDPVEAAARIMREHRIRRLPIVDERHSLVGVVSLGDLAVDLDDDRLSGDTLERVSEPYRPSRDF